MRGNQTRAITAFGASMACAFALAAIAASAQSLFLFVVVAFLAVPIVAGTAAGLAGVRVLPALGIATVTIVVFGLAFFLIDDQPSNQDGEIPFWLNAVFLLIPTLVVIAFSMTAYVGMRAFRNSRSTAL